MRIWDVHGEMDYPGAQNLPKNYLEENGFHGLIAKLFNFCIDETESNKVPKSTAADIDRLILKGGS